MTVVDMMDASRREQLTSTDHVLAQRIAERVSKWGNPRPWSSGRLDGAAHTAASGLMQAVQELHDAAQAAERRSYRADTLAAALAAEQAGWAATEDGIEAIATALAELRRLGVAVAVTTGDSRPRRGSVTIGLAW